MLSAIDISRTSFPWTSIQQCSNVGGVTASQLRRSSHTSFRLPLFRTNENEGLPPDFSGPTSRVYKHRRVNCYALRCSLFRDVDLRQNQHANPSHFSSSDSSRVVHTLPGHGSKQHCRKPVARQQISKR